jgi:hypothetical protein
MDSRGVVAENDPGDGAAGGRCLTAGEDDAGVLVVAGDEDGAASRLMLVVYFL